MILTILMGCSVLVALFGQRAGDPLRSAVRLAIVPLADGAMYLVTQFKERRRPAGSVLTEEQSDRLRKENEALRRQVHALLRERHRLWQSATIVKKVRARFGASPAFPYDLIATRVVAGEFLPYGTSRVLGAGRSQGAVDGAPVTTRGLQTDRLKALLEGSAGVIPLPQNLMTVTSAVLVGRISQAGEFTATLQLVTDAGFRMNARIRREMNPDPGKRRTIVPRGGGSPVGLTANNNERIKVEAAGDGKESLIVKDVAKAHAIRPGDSLVSRTDEDFLPAEITIGKVVVVEPDPDRPGFCKLVVRPDAELGALRKVYIVVPRGTLHPTATEGKRR